jgi:chaperonin cofactor prefoldin
MSKRIAEQKKEENIAEYILYMWQMEDMIRAQDCDPEKVEQKIVDQFPEESKEEERRWFLDLTERMKQEGITESGHLSDLQETLSELQYLHNTLLNIIKDQNYARYFEEAQKHLEEFKERTAGTVRTDIEACLHGLYGLLMLRMKQEKVSKETEEAMQTFSNVLAYLSQQYKKMKNGEFQYQWN